MLGSIALEGRAGEGFLSLREACTQVPTLESLVGRKMSRDFLKMLPCSPLVAQLVLAVPCDLQTNCCEKFDSSLVHTYCWGKEV